MRQKIIFLIVLSGMLGAVFPAKQQVQLSDSYLPVAMQIISHLTDQMAFEAADSTPIPSTSRPASTTSRVTATTPRPTTTTTRVTSTTSWPYVTTSKPTSGWWTGFTTSKRPDMTTPFHRPGIYAPFSPPRPFINRFQSRDFLLPMYNAQYTVLGPQETRSEDPFLAVHHEEVKPLVEPSPNAERLLPPHFDVKISSRSDGFTVEEIDDENLQYLSEDVRDMIKMSRDPADPRLVDVWSRAGGAGAAGGAATSKAKLSSSNLRLLLLYDLLSRDAKQQKLSDYSGFSPDVMKVLVESSSGGARAQLRTALAKMVERHDCNHEYANNRAKEMVEELGRDESKLSSEIRYLQPLVYKY